MPLSRLYDGLPQKHYLKNYIQSPACLSTHFPLSPEYFKLFFSALSHKYLFPFYLNTKAIPVLL